MIIMMMIMMIMMIMMMTLIMIIMIVIRTMIMMIIKGEESSIFNKLKQDNLNEVCVICQVKNEKSVKINLKMSV